MRAFLIYIGFIVCAMLASLLILAIVIIIASKIEDIIIDRQQTSGKHTNLTINVDRGKRFKQK